jgi:hypothetical protein
MIETPRQMRLSSTVRGVIIGVMIAGYALVVRQPAASLAASLLLAVALQIAVLVLRKLVPADNHPTAMFVFELIADGLTILLFALGVYSGVFRAMEGA